MVQFNVSSDRVRQHGRKQLFTVYTPEHKLLVSYRTIVGKTVQTSDGIIWTITNESYSTTTTKQINWFIRHCSIPVVR
jgi:hypothetical protein